MNYLFFDTETTGVPQDYKAVAVAVDNWPRLVQIGFVLYNDPFGVVDEEETIIAPDGFIIPEEATKVHGITNEVAARGVAIEAYLMRFRSLLHRADVIVGHNVSFDIHVVAAEFIRCGMGHPFIGKATVDTMLMGTDVCKLPGKKIGTYKWPKLEELYTHLFEQPIGHQHTALDDINNTVKCFFKMEELQIPRIGVSVL